MNLSDFYPQSSVHRDASFLWTMLPTSDVPHSICFVQEQRFLALVQQNPCITAVIVPPALADVVAEPLGVVVADNPQQAYYDLHNALVRDYGMAVHTESYIDPTAQIAETARIGRCVQIGAGVSVSEYAIIGDYTIIGAETLIGENVVQTLRIDGRLYPVQFAGGVRIGERCQVLANAIIQRAYNAVYTEIGDDTQISVKVSVGHAGRIGHHTMISGNTQISGGVTIGNHVWIGPGATLTDSIRVGDRARVLIGSVVIEDVPAGAVVSGNFASSHRNRLREYAARRNT
jgi:UDP-3-O-[3-hydroxymyristoyl] glucosamine N-acyltransferase